MNKENGIAKALFIFGWAVIAIGILGFFITGAMKDVYGDPHPLRWVYGLVSVASGLTTGLLFVGLSELIEQLHTMNKLLKQDHLEVGKNQNIDLPMG